jgi:hypothetical protein
MSGLCVAEATACANLADGGIIAELAASQCESAAIVKDGAPASTASQYSASRNEQIIDHASRARCYLQDAEQRRAAAALNHSAIAVDGQIVSGVQHVISNNRQPVVTVGAVIDYRQRIGAATRQIDNVVLGVRVGRGDGTLQAGDVTIGDVENGSGKILHAQQQHECPDSARVERMAIH